MAEYSHCPEGRAIGLKLINTVRRHEDLRGVQVEFVFIAKAPKSKGRQVAGRARKLGGLPAWLLEFTDHDAGVFMPPRPLFVIELAHDIWVNLTDAQKVALVDHELCHCRVEHDDDGVPHLSIDGHDVEEFIGVVERHGLWSPQMARMAKASAAAFAGELDDLIAQLNGNGPEVAG